jgi:hypothetical protein
MERGIKPNLSHMNIFTTEKILDPTVGDYSEYYNY